VTSPGLSADAGLLWRIVRMFTPIAAAAFLSLLLITVALGGVAHAAPPDAEAPAVTSSTREHVIANGIGTITMAVLWAVSAWRKRQAEDAVVSEKVRADVKTEFEAQITAMTESYGRLRDLHTKERETWEHTMARVEKERAEQHLAIEQLRAEIAVLRAEAAQRDTREHDTPPLPIDVTLPTLPSPIAPIGSGRPRRTREDDE
jgi:hypothetical protein